MLAADVADADPVDGGSLALPLPRRCTVVDRVERVRNHRSGARPPDPGNVYDVTNGHLVEVTGATTA